MSFEETDTDESASSLSEVSSLDDDFDQMRLESGSSDSEVTDEEVDSRSWNEIESDSDEEFLEDHGLVDEVTSATEGDIILPIDCCRTKLLVSWFGKPIGTRSNTCKPMRLVDGQTFVNGNKLVTKRCSSSLGSSSRWDWCKCRN